MDILNQIKDAGLELLNGHRRAVAALTVGHSVTAIDTEGRTLEITMKDGRVVANAVAPSDCGQRSGILVRKIPATVLTKNPANPRASADR